MCGILVAFDPAGTPEPVFRAALDSLHHRGPDAAGVFQSGALSIGFRRLSILDLSSAADQPMRLDDDAFVLAYNGEVYSYLEHRRLLESEGVVLRSTGDTEAVARLLQQRGERALEAFNGMFALCAYSAQRRELLLARDRLGIKPLYLFSDGVRFAAASELKALLKLPFVPREVRPQAVHDFFTFGYVAGEDSVFRGVRRLAPATWLRVRLEGDRRAVVADERRYWSLPRPGEDEPLEPSALRRQVADAVRLRKAADVPVLAFLSGGVDSTIVTSCLRQAGDVTTFTLGFEGEENDEAAAAAASAAALGTEHYWDRLAPDHDRILADFVETYDEPFGDDSALAMLLLCQGARARASVALSGDGGDELFAGYDRYVKTLRLQSWHGAVPHSLAGFLRRTLERTTGPWNRFRRLAWWLEQGPGAQYLDQTSKVHPRHLPPLPESLASWVVDAPSGAASWQERLRWMQARDLGHYLADDILVKVDRASMRSSLEARVPLLDHRLVELAFQLPREQLLRHGVRKWILREAFRETLPHHVLAGQKRGFGLPLESWLRGAWREAVLDAFESHRTSPHRVFTDEVLSLLRRGFEDGVAEARKAAWLVFVFELWSRRWLQPR